MRVLPDVRPRERRGVFAAFGTLFGITAAHVLLETARDSLFLAKLPATQLPWMYLAIAGVGLAIALLGRRRRARTHVVPALLGAAAITLAFWLVGDPARPSRRRARCATSCVRSATTRTCGGSCCSSCCRP